MTATDPALTITLYSKLPREITTVIKQVNKLEGYVSHWSLAQAVSHHNRKQLLQGWSMTTRKTSHHTNCCTSHSFQSDKEVALYPPPPPPPPPPTTIICSDKTTGPSSKVCHPMICPWVTDYAHFQNNCCVHQDPWLYGFACWGWAVQNGDWKKNIWRNPSNDLFYFSNCSTVEWTLYSTLCECGSFLYTL